MMNDIHYKKLDVTTLDDKQLTKLSRECQKEVKFRLDRLRKNLEEVE